MVGNLLQSHNKGFFSACTFLDLSKAFNTLNHKVLLKKLETYSIHRQRGDWFKSCLKDHIYYLSTDDRNSMALQLPGHKTCWHSMETAWLHSIYFKALCLGQLIRTIPPLTNSSSPCVNEANHHTIMREHHLTQLVTHLATMLEFLNALW